MDLFPDSPLRFPGNRVLFSPPPMHRWSTYMKLGLTLFHYFSTDGASFGVALFFERLPPQGFPILFSTITQKCMFPA